MNPMRWHFSRFHDKSERAQREATLERIDAWWEAFARDADSIAGHFERGVDIDIPNWMAHNLSPVSPHLCWEFGPALSKRGHRLVITPESNRYLRPVVTTILERAPTLAGWEFYPYRLAENVERAIIAVKARVGVDVSQYQVQARLGEHNCVDLCYFGPDVSGEEDRAANHAAFVATETLLGEECLDRWVGYIDAARLPVRLGLKSFLGKGQQPKGLIPLDRLKATVDALIGSLQDQLPSEPHFAWIEECEWTVWKLQPKEAEEYPSKFDMLTAVSGNPTLWQAAHQPAPFDSQRFSRSGEIFCYVKLDGREAELEEFADRSEIEDTLNEALISRKLGCAIGGGTGLRYSYVDLALTDVDQGIDVVRAVLKKGRVSLRSWIQFHDSHWAAEWVGIYDESPPPPMPDWDD